MIYRNAHRGLIVREGEPIIGSGRVAASTYIVYKFVHGPLNAMKSNKGVDLQ